jgi:BirA family biotin operon repressor/biotin-[acetyl-CoA-carboxylase] ligase
LNTISNTLFVGKVFFNFEELPSTNLYALELLSQKKPIEGTVVAAKSQSDGRGQLNNRWESEPNQNIAMSAIFYPSFLSVANHFLLNQAMALGVHDFIQFYVKKQVKIKWSNDIYVENKKIAGILIQNSLQGSTLQHSVVGIGININQLLFQSDAPNPTSFALEMGELYELEKLIEFLCKCLENRYLQLRNQQFHALRLDYAKVLFRSNEWHKYEHCSTGEYFLGKIEGVKDSGHLIMQTNRGFELFDLKEIKFFF